MYTKPRGKEKTSQGKVQRFNPEANKVKKTRKDLKSIKLGGEWEEVAGGGNRVNPNAGFWTDQKKLANFYTD